MRFSKEHEWVSLDQDTATVGITAFAAQALGDIVYVELPELGRMISQGDGFAVVESVKAASDVYAPVDGEIIAINDALVGAPESVNADPLGAAWFCKVKISDASQLDALMDLTAYEAYLKTL
jgi:glycine cleavage system H protein